MAPDIEISYTESTAVEAYSKERIGQGLGEIIEETYDAAGPVKKFRIDGEEFKLHRIWHFDDEISAHLEGSDDFIADLASKKVIEPRVGSTE